MVTNLGPFGCIPSQLAVKSVNGECVAFENKLSENFNVGLKLLLSRLNSQFHDSKFMYVDTSSRILEYRTNPTKYGMFFMDIKLDFDCVNLANIKFSFREGAHILGERQ